MNERRNGIGAFWQKTSRNGAEYWSGMLELADVELPEDGRLRVVVFPNGYKDNDRQPDLRMLLSTMPDDTTRQAIDIAKKAFADDDDDNIPF